MANVAYVRGVQNTATGGGGTLSLAPATGGAETYLVVYVGLNNSANVGTITDVLINGTSIYSSAIGSSNYATTNRLGMWGVANPPNVVATVTWTASGSLTYRTCNAELYENANSFANAVAGSGNVTSIAGTVTPSNNNGLVVCGFQATDAAGTINVGTAAISSASVRLDDGYTGAYTSGVPGTVGWTGSTSNICYSGGALYLGTGSADTGFGYILILNT
jgi:hypothetical protein